MKAHTLDSLLAKLDRESVPGCWLWKKPKANGYGEAYYQGRRGRAHRVIYELLVGPVPIELDLDHLCRNRACCNPAHLEPVTRVVNVRRGAGLAAVNARKTHCVNGHEFTPENTYLGKGCAGRDARICRACACENARRYREKKKAS